MRRRLFALALAASLVLGLSACGNTEKNEGNGAAEEQNTQSQTAQDGTGTEEETESTDKTPDGSGTSDTEGLHHVTIEVEGYGTIYCELYEYAAPVTVKNFMELAESGFYDGLTFHRVVSGFVIQGGDPSGNGTGGSEETIVGEFAVNGYENPISHTRGVLSMARAQDYDSASSQFFIMHEDASYLDGQYAAFGCVTEGMEIVDAIVENTPVEDTVSGYVAAENQPVITKITVVD